MIKFKINEYITLRLENEKSNIYINGELFEQCSYILLRKPVDELAELKVIIIAIVLTAGGIGIVTITIILLRRRKDYNNLDDFFLRF